MSEEDNIIVDGYVDEPLPGGKFRVEVKRPALESALKNASFAQNIDLGKVFRDSDVVAAVAHVSGRMRKHRVRVLRGDSVTMEMSVYSLNRGRIVKRF